MGPISRSMSSIVAAAFLVGLLGCSRGPQMVTSIEFDGVSRTIATKDVGCTKQLNGGLVIMVKGGAKRTVRVQLTQRGRIVVQKAGLRYDDMTGFVDDPREVTATRVDDTFTFNGRMPPKPGESQWHIFKIETTCPAIKMRRRPGSPG
jgi:Mycobacterium 19 kDa lipoprotein antigen